MWLLSIQGVQTLLGACSILRKLIYILFPHQCSSCRLVEVRVERWAALGRSGCASHPHHPRSRPTHPLLLSRYPSIISHNRSITPPAVCACCSARSRREERRKEENGTRQYGRQEEQREVWEERVGGREGRWESRGGGSAGRRFAERGREFEEGELEGRGAIENRSRGYGVYEHRYTRHVLNDVYYMCKHTIT